MRSDVRADAGLIERVDISIRTIQHSIKLENVAVRICATKLVAGALSQVSVDSAPFEIGTYIEAQNKDVLLPCGGTIRRDCCHNVK